MIENELNFKKGRGEISPLYPYLTQVNKIQPLGANLIYN